MRRISVIFAVIAVLQILLYKLLENFRYIAIYLVFILKILRIIADILQHVYIFFCFAACDVIIYICKDLPNSLGLYNYVIQL